MTQCSSNNKVLANESNESVEMAVSKLRCSRNVHLSEK